MKRLRLLLFFALALPACRTLRQKTINPSGIPSPAFPATRSAEPAKPTSLGPLVKLAANQYPAFSDDADTGSLRTAALQSVAYYRSLPATQTFTVGVDTMTALEMASSATLFVKLIEKARTRDEWIASIASAFDVYQSVGADAQRTVTFSSYYEPTISARLLPDAHYRFPIYGRPSDLIDVDLSLFNPSFSGSRIVGRRSGSRLVPYFKRSEIDSEGVLRGQQLEIAYTSDPLATFFLQVEGSGWLDIGDGRTVRIRYDGDNGRPFRSVGQHLIKSGRVKAQGFGHEKLQQYMDEHPDERQSLLNYNERYVFFRLDKSSTSVFAYGNINQPLTAGRSVATDPKMFPKGAIAWIAVNKDDAADRKPTNATAPPEGPIPGELMVARFVCNQDEGGAIQAAHRVDFFAGHGPEAERMATHFWNPGKLYFLIKRK